MTDLFDFTPQADVYAVMGNPVAHSKSPFIHAAFGKACGKKLSYTAIHVDVGGFKQAVGNFQAARGKGLNITVPFKHEAWELCDLRSPRAQQAGAVNTLSLQPDGRIYGDNTDGVGLVRDITMNHGGGISGKRLLLLGAGGAARGVLGPLLEAMPGRLVIANRTLDKARELVAGFNESGNLEACGYTALQGEKFDLVINATAASLHDEMPPLPGHILAEAGWCYDLMYGPAPTRFLRWAEAQNAGRIMDGLGMLVEQAAESFCLWHGVRPQTEPVIAALRILLKK